MIYRLTKIDNTFFYQNFNDFAEAEAFVNGIERMQIEQTSNMSNIPSSEKLESDKSFLLFMMDRFVYLNRQDSISPTESAELLTAFSNIKQLSEVGAVPEVYGSISDLTTPIGRVYTEERKQTDVAKISDYLAIR